MWKFWFCMWNLSMNVKILVQGCKNSGPQMKGCAINFWLKLAIAHYKRLFNKKKGQYQQTHLEILRGLQMFMNNLFNGIKDEILDTGFLYWVRGIVIQILLLEYSCIIGSGNIKNYIPIEEIFMIIYKRFSGGRGMFKSLKITYPSTIWPKSPASYVRAVFHVCE